MYFQFTVEALMCATNAAFAVYSLDRFVKATLTFASVIFAFTALVTYKRWV